MLFLLRQNRVLRPVSAWDGGRVIHLILSPQFGYGIPPCEYEVATFVGLGRCFDFRFVFAIPSSDLAGLTCEMRYRESFATRGDAGRAVVKFIKADRNRGRRHFAIARAADLLAGQRRVFRP